MSGQKSGSDRTEATHALTDERMELLMGRLLQTGVFVAAAVVAAGGLLYVVHHGTEHVAYGTFRPRPLNLRHPLSVLAALRRSGAAGVPGSGSIGVTGASGTTGVAGSVGCGTSIVGSECMPNAYP